MRFSLLNRTEVRNLDLLLRAVLSAGFLAVGGALGVRGWPLWMAVGYVAMAALSFTLIRHISQKHVNWLHTGQIFIDVAVVTAAIHLTGSLTTVGVMLYPLIIFGITMDWGMKSGRIARTASNLSYLGLLGATYAGWLRYDPYVSDVSHLEFIRAHNPVWAAVPVEALFATVALTVVGINYFTFAFARNLALQRERAERELAEATSRRAVAEVVTSMTGSLKKPLVETQLLLRSARAEIDRLRQLAGGTLDAGADMELAERNIAQCERLLGRLDELVHMKADLRDGLGLNDIVYSARKDLAREYGERVFSVHCRVDPVLPAVKGDGPLIYLAVRNLLERAVLSAHQSGGDVQISTFERGGRVVVECSDTGTGMEAGDLETLLDPFRAAIPGGAPAGLGLALVKEVIRFHDGDMSVESIPGEGTTVRVALPKSA